MGSVDTGSTAPEGEPAPSDTTASTTLPTTDKTAASANATPAEDPEGGTAKSDLAQLVAEGLAALDVPDDVWEHVKAGDEKSTLAKGIVDRLYEDRSAYAKQVAWQFAAEPILLEAVDKDERKQVAKEMLLVRTARTEEDRRLAEQQVELARQQARLVEKRVYMAGQAIVFASESVEHMKKWRSIADWGLRVLLVSVVFSILAVSYLLGWHAEAENLNGVELALVIFALALFAISPAVLLLRERPLRGLDKWMPGGSAGDSKKDEPADKTTSTDSDSAPASTESKKTEA